MLDCSWLFPRCRAAECSWRMNRSDAATRCTDGSSAAAVVCHRRSESNDCFYSIIQCNWLDRALLHHRNCNRFQNPFRLTAFHSSLFYLNLPCLLFVVVFYICSTCRLTYRRLRLALPRPPPTIFWGIWKTIPQFNYPTPILGVLFAQILKYNVKRPMRTTVAALTRACIR